MKMIVRRRGGSSSTSRAKRQWLKDGVAYNIFRAMDEDEMVSTEKDGNFENQEKEHFPVEEEGNMDDDDDEDDDEEGEDEDEEHSAKIFLVGDDVWETKTFSKWREMNWALFSYDIPEVFFYRLPEEYFKPGEDPRFGRRLDELKMGHTFWYVQNHESISLRFVTDDSSYGARLAIEFFNSENQMGKTLKFESLSMVSYGIRRYEPSGYVYFLTIVATKTDTGIEREFQASFFRPHENMNIWFLTALREKPYVY